MAANVRIATCAVLMLAINVGHAEDDGRQFFNEQVVPKLAQNGCFACHSPARGYVSPAMNYDSLLRVLAIGQSSDNNVLIYKLANQRSFASDRPTHMGGQRCQTEGAEPCVTIKRWWKVEFPSDPTAPTLD